MEKWKNYLPEFECDNYNKDMLKYSPWSGHRLFAYDLIANVRPETVVELGSFYGCSIFAFAQAVKDLQLKTVLWGVDLWEIFDEFTKDDYKEDVFDSFLQVRDKCYDEKYVKMLRMSFDEALDKFDNKSIDILHIDGSHYYDDVKHDFETWKPKLKDDAIVLFHDISDEIINGGIMGSHIFWEELKNEYSNTIEFDYSCGLGILFMSKKIYKNLKNEINVDYYQKMCNSFDVQLKDDIRKLSFKIRDSKIYIDDLLKQKDILNEHLEAYKKSVGEKDKYAQKLVKQRERDIDEIKTSYEKTIEEINENNENELKRAAEDYAKERNAIINDYENDKKAAIVNYEKQIETVKNNYEETIRGKEAYITELETKIVNIMAERDKFETDYKNSINYKFIKFKQKIKK